MVDHAIERVEVSRFVATSNIVRFTALLEHETDPKETALLQRMLAEERERLRQTAHVTACVVAERATVCQ